MFDRYQLARRKRLAMGDGGFTLIEVLIVIVVLGILAAVVVFALGGVTDQSAVAACNADAKTVIVAVSAEQNQYPGIPPTSTNLVSGVSGGQSYLKTFPSNPSYYTITIGGLAPYPVMVSLPQSDPWYTDSGVTPAYTAGAAEQYEGSGAWAFTAPTSLVGNICQGA